MKQTLIATLMALGLAASSAFAAEESYDSIVAAAKKEIEAADQMGHLWRDTEKTLKEAEKAMKAGDEKKALKLAQQALGEARAAQQQAKDQANAKPQY